MNVEIQLITKVLDTGDWTVVTDKQVTQKYMSGRNKTAWVFIQNFMLKYGKVPSKKVFKLKNPSFDLAKDVSESLSFYCDEVRHKFQHNLIADTVEEVSEHIESLESGEAYELIKKLVLKVENEVILSDRVEVNKNTKSRLEDYHTRAKSGGITGLPSGIDRLDYVLKGFNNGELTALLGYTGTGKSWLEIIIAVFMAKMGYKVLLFTTEMSTKMMIRRVDAVWCKLSYSRFVDGKLMPDELTRYEKYLDKIEGDTDTNLIIEQATGGLSQVGAKIDQHKPEMVMIDGAYLLEDEERGEDDWKGLVRVFRGLHRMCLTKKIPMLASTQSKDRKVALDTISFAKAISNDCDIVMALEQDDEMKQDKEIRLKFLKIREGKIPGHIMMNWDFDKMDYGTLFIEGFSGDRIKDDIQEDYSDVADVPTGVQILA